MGTMLSLSSQGDAAISHSCLDTLTEVVVGLESLGLLPLPFFFLYSFHCWH